MNKKWIVTCYKTDWHWIENYTSNYIVYDKTGELPETDKVKHQKNVGYNIYDIAYFIVNNYDNLPDVCVFLKANVFKHCKKEVFDILIKNDCFTPLEYYGPTPANNWEKRTASGGFLELNNGWYVEAVKGTYGPETKRYLDSANHFFNIMFKNPEPPGWLRFAPGAEYIVPKENLLYYSIDFWKKIMGFVDYHQLCTEAHVLERCLYYIFTNEWEELK